MRILDILFGRTRPVKARPDAIFAMATAAVTLETRLELKPAGRAGICFKPVGSSYFEELERDLDRILELSERETSTKVDSREDQYGFRWVVLEDRDFEDLVNTIYLVSSELQAHGFGEQLLAAVFRFERKERPVFWIYNYKRGTFYPFVPLGRGKRRDNGLELRLQAVMARELPVEQQTEQWFALWDVPV